MDYAQTLSMQTFIYQQLQQRVTFPFEDAPFLFCICSLLGTFSLSGIDMSANLGRMHVGGMQLVRSSGCDSTKWTHEKLCLEATGLA